MNTLEIIGAPQSVFVRTVRLACEEKGVPYRLIAASPHSQAVLAINPFGRIPVLRHGDVTLFESRAITTYVDQAFGGPALCPPGATECARMEQWISALNAEILPTFVAYTRANYLPTLSGGSLDRTVIDPLLPKVLAHIELLAETVSTTHHLAGSHFTLADMGLMPMLAYLRGLPESGRMIVEARPLASYFERHVLRPSWIATEPPPMSDLAR